MEAVAESGFRKLRGLPSGVSISMPTAALWQPMSHQTPPPCFLGSQNQGS